MRHRTLEQISRGSAMPPSSRSGTVAAACLSTSARQTRGWFGSRAGRGSPGRFGSWRWTTRVGVWRRLRLAVPGSGRQRFGARSRAESDSVQQKLAPSSPQYVAARQDPVCYAGPLPGRPRFPSAHDRRVTPPLRRPSLSELSCRRPPSGHSASALHADSTMLQVAKSLQYFRPAASASLFVDAICTVTSQSDSSLSTL